MNSAKLTSLEKQWRETVLLFAHHSNWLNYMYGACVKNPKQIELDHILGARAKRKINGVTTKVGEFAIMPVPIEMHSIAWGYANHPQNRTTNKGAYRDVFGHEKQVWLKMVDAMKNRGIETPFSNEIIEAILR